MPQPLDQIAHEVAKRLQQTSMKIVFAESCTGGLVSATLARVPGISNHLCGSAVVYRLETKTRWLGVPESMLATNGPVSEPVAKAMAEGVLNVTPEANLSASITGHLGPDAPESQDGLLFVGVAVRDKKPRTMSCQLKKFEDGTELDLFPGQNPRERRQWAAVEFLLAQVVEVLQSESIDH
jgi:PncC family amidohydrolase